MSSSTTQTSQPGYCDRSAAGNAVLAMTIINLTFATILVPARTYIRLRVNMAFWWDDVLLIAAYLLLIPGFITEWRMIDLGLGRHEACYSSTDLSKALEDEYIGQTLFLFSTACSRSSVALFLGRLFATTKPIKLALYAWTVFSAVTVIICAGVTWAYCTPAKGLWDPNAGASCWPQRSRDAIGYLDGAVGAASDFILALTPIYFLCKLNMAMRKKVALCILLGLGLVPGVCCLLRTILAHTETSTDPLYNSSLLNVFASVEVSMLIICAAIPGISPSVSIFRKWSTSSNRS